MVEVLPHYVLATAGHVDHGKSSLVKALTGTDPDRLPEEKARGITIDLGFAFMEIAGPGPLPARFHLAIVDVPGHEDFVKNMVSGLSAIDLALLVVAADDGWMPQTEEHLQILQYLGVTRAVVALTKIDLVPDENAVVSAIRTRLSGSAFADAPIIPTSTVSGRGLDELKNALAETLANTPPSRDYGKPRVAIDRAFTLRGIGTVATGTLAGGSLQRGQGVVLQPSGRSTRVRGLQSHNQEIDCVRPGMRSAFNLADVTLTERGAAGDEGVRRGQWITLPEVGLPVKTVDVLLERSARSLTGAHSQGRALKDSTLVRVHHGAENAIARVILAGAKQLLPGETSLAQLRFQSPVFAFLGDRMVLRDCAEQTTLGGVIVLDASSSPRTFRSAAQQALLNRRAKSPGNAGVAVATQLARDKIVRTKALLGASRFSEAEVTSAVRELQTAGELFVDASFIAEDGWWKRLLASAALRIDEHHKTHPQDAGLPLSQWRAALERELPLTEAIDVLTAELRRTGFAQSSNEIHRQGHRPALPAQLQASGTQLRAMLGAKPMEPPSRKELTPSATAQQALRFLIQSGEAVEISAEVVLLRESYQRAVELIKRHLGEHASATVSELRTVVGASRRIVVPLLEKLDKEGVTRRQGDARFLR